MGFPLSSLLCSFYFSFSFHLHFDRTFVARGLAEEAGVNANDLLRGQAAQYKDGVSTFVATQRVRFRNVLNELLVDGKLKHKGKCYAAADETSKQAAPKGDRLALEGESSWEKALAAAVDKAAAEMEKLSLAAAVDEAAAKMEQEEGMELEEKKEDKQGK